MGEYSGLLRRFSLHRARHGKPPLPIGLTVPTTSVLFHLQLHDTRRVEESPSVTRTVAAGNHLMERAEEMGMPPPISPLSFMPEFRLLLDSLILTKASSEDSKPGALIWLKESELGSCGYTISSLAVDTQHVVFRC